MLFYYISYTVFLVIIILLLVQYFKLKNKNKDVLKKLTKKEKDKWVKSIQEARDNFNKESIKLNEEHIQLLQKNYDARDQLIKLNNEIEVKKDFNDSMLKIREDELERLMNEKRAKAEALWEKEIEDTTKQIQEWTISAQEAAETWNQVLQEQLNQQILDEQKFLEEIKKEIEDYKLRREVINKEILRQKELQEKEDFYKIQISKNDIEDIEVLEQIRPRLKNKEALSKLIWEVFIRRPLQEMIKRVTGGRKIGGIYKITYVKTGESYIGKTSSDFGTRWQNHVKTATGLDGAAHSSLHTHMERNGIQNYTFEILEEVEKEKQSEREKYWIDFYGTKQYGLNQKEGG